VRVALHVQPRRGAGDPEAHTADAQPAELGHVQAPVRWCTVMRRALAAAAVVALAAASVAAVRARLARRPLDVDAEEPQP
jgi:hypothetical protein